jgi:fumarylacetoacetase
MSWIKVFPSSHFPIQNLPFGIFSRKTEISASVRPQHRFGVAIGDYVVDIPCLYYAGLFNHLSFDGRVLLQPTLNAFMSLNRSAWREFRLSVKNLLDDVTTDRRLRDNEHLQASALIPMSDVQMHLPATIGDYTDFYSSREHASNIGIMLRGKDNALQPNWLHLPVGYHGRASSVVISGKLTVCLITNPSMMIDKQSYLGTDVVRPSGQVLIDPTDPSKGPMHHPSRALDFELEMAFFVGGPSNPLGKPLTIEEAEERIFGVVLMNDWSARDVQAWEYVPLGPFTSKNFCTSISPWIVSLDALDAFRCMSSAGQSQEPLPLGYLQDSQYHRGSYDVSLQVHIQGIKDSAASMISESNLKYMYWNFKQQLVHHSVSGCNLRAGDLLATGTISGPTDESMGSMMELSWKGSREVKLTNSQEAPVRKYLQDGDLVCMTGCARSAEGYVIGFGEVSGRILPAATAAALPSAETVAAAPMRAQALPEICQFKLYNYHNSSSSHRVRIALNLKKVAYDYIPIDLKPVSLVILVCACSRFSHATPAA